MDQAVGHRKKNFLFIGHPDAGDRSAIIYSIIVSCQYVTIRWPTCATLSRLPSMTNQDDLGALTPACCFSFNRKSRSATTSVTHADARRRRQ